MISILRETHEAPAEVARALALAGGRNLFGEANYRAVWGWSRLDWIGGKWEDRDPVSGALVREVVELRREPKYLPHDRWHIERWMPPESYGSPGAVARADSRNCERAERCGARAVSFARGLRALLHAGGAAGRVRATDAGGGAAHRARDRNQPRHRAGEEKGSARGARRVARSASTTRTRRKFCREERFG